MSHAARDPIHFLIQCKLNPNDEHEASREALVVIDTELATLAADADSLMIARRNICERLGIGDTLRERWPSVTACETTVVG